MVFTRVHSAVLVTLAATSLASLSFAGVTIELARRSGPGVQVAVRLRDITPTPAAGYQVFLEFDQTRLSFVSGSYVTDQFGLPVVSPISASGNQVTVAAGIAPFLGNTPTSVDQDVALLNFSPVGTGCATRVRVRVGTNPPTRVTDDLISTTRAA